jgi:hypothetical protein
MAEAITLLEAWVKFNTKGADAAQQREVEKSLETFKVGLSTLIGAATAAAATVTAATAEMAKGLFTVYYEAQRIGSTVERITAFGQAVEQAGGSAETAKADLENFAKKFRVNPAFREAIKSLGHISAEDMKDAQSAYIALSKFLSEQRKTEPIKYGQAMKFSGLDESTVLAIGRPQFGRAYKENLEFWNKGLDAIADKSVRLNEDWLKVKQHLDTIFTLASGKWMDIESGMLERFDAFLDANKELFKKISDAVASTFIDEKGKFDLFASSKRVYPALWNWLKAIDFSKLKNAFTAFANWLTAGWFADKIKSVFGSIGGGVKTAVEAVERAVEGPSTKSPGDEAYASSHPGWRPGMPKEQTRHQAAPAAPFVPTDHSLGAQTYIGRGGYGPFSHEQTSGAGQDFNIPGPGKQSGADDTIWPLPGETIQQFQYRQDKALGVKPPKPGWDYPQGHEHLYAMLHTRPLDAGSRQWSRHDGAKTQEIRVTINSTDPHSAAHETARQLAHLQNQTMRDWRRVG